MQEDCLCVLIPLLLVPYFFYTVFSTVMFYDKTVWSKWENYSRRQKIFIGVLRGPIVLLHTLIWIFLRDTEILRKKIYEIGEKYFNLLK